MTNASWVEPYANALGRSVADVVRDLESYADLLQKWQKVQNLVSRETLDRIWPRHFADSLRILPHLSSDDTSVVDLGSGGGFPALPLAIASRGLDRRFILIEPTGRKVSFLRTVARELDLNVTVIGERIEDLDSRETSDCHVITSRALAGLPQLMAWMAPIFGPSTRALLHKGREHVEELKDSRASFQFDVLIHPGDSDPGGVILEISNLRGVSTR
jgi:16S rRNA (guanine527-N7)-methyltransferase